MTYNTTETRELQGRAPLITHHSGDLIISSERDGDVHTIALHGELDLATADEVDRELRRVEGTDARSIVLDLTGLSFMDSTGIRVILSADVRSRADANRLRLVHGPTAVRRVFELSGVVDLLPFAD
jgi:anti-sigma B factor antagonist